MKYFLDTEFMEDGTVIELVSIALKCEDGRKLYLVNSDHNPANANDFVKKYVFPYIYNDDGSRKEPEFWATKNQIRDAVVDFVGKDENIEFWAWYGSYDWVCVAQLFGTMVDLPRKWPMWFHELKQLAEVHANPLGPAKGNSHHPLADAEWAEAYHAQLNGTHVKRSTDAYFTEAEEKFAKYMRGEDD